MPLHDWKDERGWDGVHLLWIASLLRWVQPRLPEGYRAYVGSVPRLTIDTGNGRPDLNVRRWGPPPAPPSEEEVADPFRPDREAVATFELDPQKAVHIDLNGVLIAAIELVSPRNKDRQSSKERSLSRYLGYLRQGVHLLLVDVFARPPRFSFADALAADLGYEQPACPAPFALSYRVGEPMPPGTFLADWLRPLRVGGALPTIPLALDVHQAVLIDLELTYVEAARAVYLA